MFPYLEQLVRPVWKCCFPLALAKSPNRVFGLGSSRVAEEAFQVEEARQLIAPKRPVHAEKQLGLPVLPSQVGQF